MLIFRLFCGAGHWATGFGLKRLLASLWTVDGVLTEQPVRHCEHALLHAWVTDVRISTCQRLQNRRRGTDSQVHRDPVDDPRHAGDVGLKHDMGQDRRTISSRKVLF